MAHVRISGIQRYIMESIHALLILCQGIRINRSFNGRVRELSHVVILVNLGREMIGVEDDSEAFHTVKIVA